MLGGIFSGIRNWFKRDNSQNKEIEELRKQIEILQAQNSTDTQSADSTDTQSADLKDTQSADLKDKTEDNNVEHK